MIVVADAMLQMSLLSVRVPTSEAELVYDAAWVGDPETAECLLSHGAEVDARDGQAWKPLRTVADCPDSTGPEYRKAVEWLLAAGASVNAQAGNGDTRLKLAMNNEYTGPADLLRERRGRE